MKKFTSKRQKIGELGERIAVLFLMKHGFTVIERNYTKQYGEIDIVAWKNNIWHFIEVKAVSYETFHTKWGIRPEENMHRLKFLRFSRTVEVYVLEKHIKDPWQIDLLTVRIDQLKKQGNVQYFPNIIF